MKQLGIYLSPIASNDGPKFEDEPYTKGYPQLFALLYKYGVTPLLVHSQEKTYRGKGIFSEFFVPVFEGEKLVKYRHHKSDVKIDLVYDKARFRADDIAILNPLILTDIARDKYRSYQLLPELHANTVMVNDRSHLEKVLQNYKDDIVVIKAPDSSGGKGVYIGPGQGYTYSISYPLVVQEYVETELGYAGIVQGRHDVRVCMFDGEIIGGKLRTPPKDGFLSNIAMGGKNYSLMIDQIPSELKDLTKEITSTLGNIEGHTFISADFGYNGTRWVLFEINPWTGLVDADKGEAEKQYMDNLARKLADSVK